MIHGYHVIMPMYGFWLPNDPRGAWSDYVRKFEIAKHGHASKSLDRKDIESLTDSELRDRNLAIDSLKYPSVSIEGVQALAISQGFAKQIEKSNYTAWACSVLPEHTHFVLARHSYKVEQVTNLLKGAATASIVESGLHPLAAFAQKGQRPPRMWAARGWKQYLDSEEAIENAINYVVENPEKEGKRIQSWSFVTPFAGIEKGGWTTYQ
ncbi:hypothetical protein [Mariniblastus fucicola]|uniref:Transposase IS200-like domain-containing protein n=1 Tax=Mariniblastus fucicola TaxID=980251 RepID=A0A5B9PDS2_9BACT|nr:hypothetical protein [Mariniblastus fucicola]QEG21093.1 hypothetical protein MFFC18_09450 [Mariniblastus fucicola]